MINRMNDRFFKAIFGTEKHKNLTLSLLNAIFEFEGTALVKDITFDDREIDPEYKDGKLSILDIKGETQDGTKIFIEIQALSDKTFPVRPLYYWSKIYPYALKKGEPYTELTRTVGINILNFSLFEYEDYHSKYALYNSKNHHLLTDHLELHFIELTKWNVGNLKEMKRLDRWIAYLSNRISEKEMEEIAMNEPAIMNALQAEQEFIKNPTMMEAYDQREEEIRRFRTAMDVSRIEGKAEGKAEGIELVAVNLLKMGTGAEKISQATGLAEERINELKKKFI